MAADVSQQLAAGLSLQSAGELAAAERCYLDVVAQHGAHGEALKLLAVLALDRGDLSGASAYVEAALLEQPTAGEYLHLLGGIKLRQGDLGAAVEALSGAIAAGAPHRVQALVDLATCHARRKAWQDSLAAARAALVHATNHPDAQRIAGYACFYLGSDAEGLAHFERVLASEPNNAAVLHATSVMLLRSGNPGAASERASQACQHAPDNHEYEYQRRTAGAGAVPSWHFNMLNDSARNAAFAQAISAQVEPGQLVLEIGTGAGLLALLAARGSGTNAGARVVTCEANRTLARVATQVIAANGFAERVQVVAKPSTELQLGVDLPERADVLICEIFSVQVIAEGVLPTLEDAKARLLKPNARVIPARASARGALVAGEGLARKVRVGQVHGFDLSALNTLAPIVQYLQPDVELTLLSEAVDLLSFDLAGGSHFPAERRILEVPVSVAGRCQGVVQWLRLDLLPGLCFENRPDSAEPGASQHWAPVFYPFPEPVSLEVGQNVALRVSHNRVGVRVEFAGVKP